MVWDKNGNWFRELMVFGYVSRYYVLVKRFYEFSEEEELEVSIRSLLYIIYIDYIKKKIVNICNLW